MGSKEREPFYPWERQPGEPEKAYQAFRYFLAMAPSEIRTVRGTMRALGGSWGKYSRWSTGYSWIKRAGAYDKHQRKQNQNLSEKDIREMYERQAKHAVLGQAVAMATLSKYIKTKDNPHPKKMGTRDAIRLFDIMSRVEIRSRGEPEIKTETLAHSKVEVQTEDIDSSRAMMVKLLEDPEAVEHMAAISKLMGTDGGSEE